MKKRYILLWGTIAVVGYIRMQEGLKTLDYFEQQQAAQRAQATIQLAEAQDAIHQAMQDQRDLDRIVCQYKHPTKEKGHKC